MKYVGGVRSYLEADENLIRARSYTHNGLRALPSAAAEYVADKAPILQWFPKYCRNPQWIINDAVAGITLGVMLIPQALSYASLAKVPLQYGLMASWLPGLIYAVMGTSKDLSTGPTSIISLLTGEVVLSLTKQGFAAQDIAAAIGFLMGIYALIVGLLKLGFLLDFVSGPVLHSFISALAITIILSQVDSLLGESSASGSTAEVIHEVFQRLPEINGRAAAVGFASIAVLVLLQFVGTRWGSKSKIAWYFSIGRAAIALILFTGISYGFNHGLKTPLFSIIHLRANGIEKPKLVNLALVRLVAGRSVAPFIAMSLEHISIGKTYAARNDYVLDESQELTYLGVTNFFNSFFSAIGVGGAMSRTAVNSQSGVKSPLSGVLSSGVIIFGLYKLSPVLYWVPEATLSAIIILAVYPMVCSLSTFYGYWRTSFADFIASMLSFWLTLFVNSEVGIGTATGFNIIYFLLRNTFSRTSILSDSDLRRANPPTDPIPSIPETTKIFRFHQAIFFPNAYRQTTNMLDRLKTWHANASVDSAAAADNVWSVSGATKLRRMRAKAGADYVLPGLDIVVLDFSEVSYLDTTGLLALADFRKELRRFFGAHVQLRFAGLQEAVRYRFLRRGWTLVDEGDEAIVSDDAVVVFQTVPRALQFGATIQDATKDSRM